jgi:hypothetical protein
MRLDHQAAIKLLEIADTPAARIGARVLDEHFPRFQTQFLTSHLLRPVGVNPVIAGMDDHEDAPISLEWSDKHNGYGYFSDQLDWVAAPTEDLQVYDIDFTVFLAQLTVKLDVHAPSGVVALIPDYLWELGDVALPGRRQRISLWLGRCLADPEVENQIRDHAMRRPNRALRPFLTTTDARRLPSEALPGHMVISIRDVLDYGHGLAIDPGVLLARINQTPTPDVASALALSRDGTRLTINGSVVIDFKSDIHISMIKQLHDDFHAGRRSRAKDLLTKARSSAMTLKKAFGDRKWAELEPYLKADDDHLWGFVL